MLSRIVVDLLVRPGRQEAGEGVDDRKKALQRHAARLADHVHFCDATFDEAVRMGIAERLKPHVEDKVGVQRDDLVIALCLIEQRGRVGREELDRVAALRGRRAFNGLELRLWQASSLVAVEDAGDELLRAAGIVFGLRGTGVELEALDIAVDAWRIESAPDDEQANMAAVYILGYRLAIMFAGVGLIIAAHTSWMVAYLVMAASMALVGGLILRIREPNRPEKRQDTDRPLLLQIRDAVVQPFWQIVARYGRWVVPVLLLVGLYRLSDFTMGTMASPFYADLGYSKETVGVITGLLGPWPIVVGGFVGGFVAVRYRLMPALLVGAVITLLTNGAFAGLALAAGPELDLAASGDPTAIVNTPSDMALLVVIVADNLAAGYVGTVFVAYLSSLTEREFAATQYALFSSAYSLFCKLMAASTSGPLAESVGWAGFYMITALYVIPSFILIGIIMKYGPDHARGIIPDSADEATDLDAKESP